MKHFYSEYGGITLTYGDIAYDDALETVPVYFERDDEQGDFDFAEGLLPFCSFSRSRGFSEYELTHLKKFLKNNQHIILDFARAGI